MNILETIQIETFSAGEAAQLQDLLDTLSGRLCDVASTLNYLDDTAPSLAKAIRVQTLDQDLSSLGDQIFELATIFSDRAKEAACNR